MGKLERLEKEIEALKLRNRRVEADKAWEKSRSRKIAIFVLTYIGIAAYFYAVKLPDPLLNSVVPAMAFVVSTLTLPRIKEYWLKSRA